MKDIKYISRIAFSAFALKSLFLGLNWPTIGAFCISSIVYLVSEYISYKKELSKFQEQLNKQNEELVSLQDKVTKLASAFSSFQMVQGISKAANRINIAP